MSMQPPAPINVRHGKPIKFRVVGPGSRRSTTWVVKAQKNKPDIYFGMDDSMGQAKLSLHGSEFGRFAWTSEHSAVEGIADRELQRYRKADEQFRGWRRAVSLLIPASSLMRPIEEDPDRARAISEWPIEAGYAFRFDVLRSEPGADLNMGVTAVGRVGSSTLSDQTALTIIADCFRTTPDLESGWQAERESVQSRASGPREDPSEYVSGAVRWSQAPDGAPAIVDLGEPAGFDPGESPRWLPGSP